VAVAPELLEILVCPRCRGGLQPTPAGDGLACARCSLCYPVVDDIPVMVPEEALPWGPAPPPEGARP
jgi:hypothetical protein